jgi:hypothetical protein
MGDQKFIILSSFVLRKAPTKPHWARVVGYGLFSLCAIHKEGLCPSSGDINRLMMLKMNIFNCVFINKRAIYYNVVFHEYISCPPKITRKMLT